MIFFFPLSENSTLAEIQRHARRWAGINEPLFTNPRILRQIYIQFSFVNPCANRVTKHRFLVNATVFNLTSFSLPDLSERMPKRMTNFLNVDNTIALSLSYFYGYIQILYSVLSGKPVADIEILLQIFCIFFNFSTSCGIFVPVK